MARLDIPLYIDVDYLNIAAGLQGNYNVLPSESPGMKTLEFMSAHIPNVDAAMATYDADYLEYRKMKRLEEIADLRRFHELKGPSGLVLDDKTSLRLVVVALDLTRRPEKTSVRWEVSRGNFMLFPRETILALADASVDKVQACFDRVHDLTVLVKAITLANGLEQALSELDAIEITTGWPT